MLDDTIAAIATPLGEGGLAVVRISGAAALAVADGSAGRDASPARGAGFGWICMAVPLPDVRGGI